MKNNKNISNQNGDKTVAIQSIESSELKSEVLPNCIDASSEIDEPAPVVVRQHKLKGIKKTAQERANITAGIRKFHARRLAKKLEEDPDYKPTLSRSEGYDAKRVAAWVASIHKFSEYQCVLTGNKNATQLECHHLESWYTSEEGRYDVLNGVCLDKTVHKKFHREYGSHVSRDNFIAFVKKYYPNTDCLWNNKLSDITGLNQIPGLQTVDEKMASMVTFQEKMYQRLLDLAKARNHVFVSGTYVNQRSMFKIRCNIHDKEFDQMARNYQHFKHGLNCCGRAATGKAVAESNKNRNKTGDNSN